MQSEEESDSDVDDDVKRIDKMAADIDEFYA